MNDCGEPPIFDDAFRAQLERLFAWRRDVRHFRRDALAEADIDALLGAALGAPSVGNSQPWRILRVESPALRESLAAHVDRCNAEAAAGYRGAEQNEYRALKLHGLREAPVQLAFFCDHAPHAGRGLGRRTMPATLDWSVVMAIHSLWLAARARGIGLGWVSILEPEAVGQILAVPPHWALIGYICLGYAAAPQDEPELAVRGWQSRLPIDEIVFRR